MKSIKFIFAVAVISIAFASCSATSMDEDTELYSEAQMEQAIGGDTEAVIMSSRD